MEGMERIGKAILDKVKADAEQIINEAEEQAWRELEKAEKKRETRFEDEKRKALEEAERQAARIKAQALIRARQELSGAKAQIIEGIVSRAKSILPALPSDEASFLRLTEEAVGELNADKVRIYVAKKDMSAMQELVKRNEGLASAIMGIKELDCTGGIIAESADGKISIDNTYETRLEMLVPQILPEISRELFADS